MKGRNSMKNFIDKIKGFFVKVGGFFAKGYRTVKDFFVNTIELCKDKSGKVNWKQVWEHTTTVLLILVLASPLFILAYIMGWFFTRQQL